MQIGESCKEKLQVKDDKCTENVCGQDNAHTAKMTSAESQRPYSYLTHSRTLGIICYQLHVLFMTNNNFLFSAGCRIFCGSRAQ